MIMRFQQEEGYLDGWELVVCRGGDALEGAESEIWCEANARVPEPPPLTTPSATNANATLKVCYPLHSVWAIFCNRANQKALQAFFDTPDSL